MTQNADRREAALDWLVRTNDPDFEAWDEFTAWLEADSSNAGAYHALADSEARMKSLLDAIPVESAPDRTQMRPRLAIAAGVAAFAALATAVLAPRMMAVEYSTAPGEVRVVSLGGRDQLVMNGDTRLELAGFDHRTVRLAEGQVLLRLNEPGQDKIELLSGDLKLVDVGTVFEVARDGRDTRVVVSEGAVIADPRGAALKLLPGQRLDTTDGAAILQAMPADISTVGSFQTGQLSYVDEPLDNVVADLRRSTGIDFSASSAISARRFSGTLSVGEVKRDPRSLAPLLGVSVEQSGQGWKLGGKV
ncbi:MAG TPA: FecR domain-containing protein [Sphingomicrobium sp.]|nr:FecR domain-containing protein [Sphingomicrobium sp.]